MMRRPRRRPYLKIALVTTTALFLVLVLAGALVLVPIARDLRGASDELSGSLVDMDADRVARAEERLGAAESKLGGLGSDVLGTLPVLAQNLRTLEEVVPAARRVVRRGGELVTRLESFESDGLFSPEGTIRLDALEALGRPLRRQAAALATLGEVLQRERNPVLMPGLTASLDRLEDRLARSEKLALSTAEFVGIAGDLFGVRAPRTYLVLLMNNAELRGAGGLLAALGTIEFKGGRLELGSFYSADRFRDLPRREVDAPRGFKRRYGRYEADTTLTVNTTFSPDVPAVARVAANILKEIEGLDTDGVILIDPRGLEALIPEWAEVPIPGTDLVIQPDEFADFVYSDSYDLIEDRTQRQTAVLEAGLRAFRQGIREGFGDRWALESIAQAIGAGHARFVPFDPGEQRVLTALGATGDLTSDARDRGMMVAQNLGDGKDVGNKLDYWIRRDVVHRCQIDEAGGADCTVEIELQNRTPEGLSTYVAGRPYGLMRSLVEIYLPGDSVVTHTTIESEDTRFRQDEQSGMKVLLLLVQFPPGDRRKISVGYELAPPQGEPSYTLELRPQPLARDAHLEVSVVAPAGWDVIGPVESAGGILQYAGPFDGTFKVRAAPSQRSGLGTLLDRLSFWN